MSLSVNQHKLFIDSLLTQADHDEIDAECEIDPLLLDRPVQRRSGREINRLIDILDELDGTKKGWDA